MKIIFLNQIDQIIYELFVKSRETEVHKTVVVLLYDNGILDFIIIIIILNYIKHARIVYITLYSKRFQAIQAYLAIKTLKHNKRSSPKIIGRTIAYLYDKELRIVK